MGGLGGFCGAGPGGSGSVFLGGGGGTIISSGMGSGPFSVTPSDTGKVRENRELYHADYAI